MDRLLTDEELFKAYDFDFVEGDISAVAKAQDKKTLQVVGEWLENLSENTMSDLEFYSYFSDAINKLQKGEFPE
jgi:hypothetical protein